MKSSQSSPSSSGRRLWRRLLAYAWREPRVFLVFVLTGVLVALVDAFLPLISRAVVDSILLEGREANLVPHATGFLLLSLLLVLCVRFFVHLGGRLRTRISHDIRAEAFSKLQDLSFSYFDKRPVGWLMARMTSDCERLSNILAWGILDLVWGVTLLISITIAMLALHLELALWVLTVVPIGLWISFVFKRRILRSSRQVRKLNSKITARYNESIQGVRTTKTFGRQALNGREFDQLSGEMHSAAVRNQLQAAVFLPLVLCLGSVATGLALGIGGLEVFSGALTLGTLVAFLNYTRLFFEPLTEMAHWFAELQMAQASAERILGVIDEEPAIRDAPGTESTRDPAPFTELSLSGVSFAYDPKAPVLREVNLRIPAGQTVALVGSTGSGKTTLVNLICRFYEPTSGSIRFDGVDYRRRSLAWLQKQLGIVLQTPHLFSGTIRENIRYGDPEASDQRVEEAAKRVGADVFIERLDRGYETEVGEGGSRLSIGQKQLVSFARAILADPRILILDEATSSIDTETEAAIQRGLASVLQGRTAFLIAHRLSTIQGADRILVLEKGRIVEDGTHRELIARPGRYRQLYARQSLTESAGESTWSSVLQA